MLVIVFSITAFLSAVLLFLVEPILAKMLLPLLGGTPEVWNTCMVFFQAMLLAGYLYAHGTFRLLSRRMQAALHLALVAVAGAIISARVLELPEGWHPPTDVNPAAWLIAALFVTVGLPFFVLSSTAPVLQRWFAHSGHKLSDDPYFLYAASNAGSLAGLIAYPLLLEPALHLSTLKIAWSRGFPVLTLLVVLCGVLAIDWTAEDTATTAGTPRLMSEPLRWKQKLRWVALAFVPSSLMLGATTALTSEVPALPLFWVLPLALYLISFIFVFARHKLIPQSLVVKVLPALLLVGLLPETFKFRLPLVSLMTVYLSTLFCVALFCHGELALSRPRVDRLTEFYLLISLGGVLGGIFNALLAPLIFHSATEFPLVIVFASLLRPSQDNASNPMLARRDWLYPLLLGSVMTAFILLAQRLHYVAGWLIATLFFSYSALACFSFHRRRLRFSLGVITFLAAASLYSGPYGNIAETARNFFGVVHVSIDPTGHYRELLHEGTVHGLQSLDPLRSRQPLAYYTRTGPVGQVFNMLQKRLPNARIAVVGLGAGSMACLTHQGEPLTYYEIDPLVVRFARDQRYFTYLEQCAPEAKIILGDARLEMRKAEDASYDLIALDAFSGDSVPVHLLTQDALRLYLQKLAPGGVLAFHISSIYLDIEPILGDLARDTGLVSRIQVDMAVPGQVEPGHYPSVWLVMARTDHDLSGLTDVPHSQWKTVRTNDQPVWTDDYSNLLSIIRWH